MGDVETRRPISCRPCCSLTFSIGLHNVQHASHMRTLPVNRSPRSICSRMRNPGGFQLPPRIPHPGDRRSRAIELLGNCTQHLQRHAKVHQELIQLIGEAPPNRERAQQWKRALQELNRKASQRTNWNVSTPLRHRKRLLDVIRLPDDDARLSTAFHLLDHARRRLAKCQSLSEETARDLKRIIGYVPNDLLDLHHVSRTLVYLQRARRREERRPRTVPIHDAEALASANSLLGNFAACGKIGKQSERLELIVGSLPRNRNVARWWKKTIAAAIRKKKRKERVLKRRQQIETKRLERIVRVQRRIREARLGVLVASMCENRITTPFGDAPGQVPRAYDRQARQPRPLHYLYSLLTTVTHGMRLQISKITRSRSSPASKQ